MEDGSPVGIPAAEAKALAMDFIMVGWSSSVLAEDFPLGLRCGYVRVKC